MADLFQQLKDGLEIPLETARAEQFCEELANRLTARLDPAAIYMQVFPRAVNFGFREGAATQELRVLVDPARVRLVLVSRDLAGGAESEGLTGWINHAS